MTFTEWFTSIPVWGKLWFGWVMFGLALQTAATVINPKGQLSHQVWSTIDGAPLLHSIITVFMVWVGYHWCVEHTWDLDVRAMDDFIIVGIGVLVAALISIAR